MPGKGSQKFAKALKTASGGKPKRLRQARHVQRSMQKIINEWILKEEIKFSEENPFRQNSRQKIEPQELKAWLQQILRPLNTVVKDDFFVGNDMIEFRIEEAIDLLNKLKMVLQETKQKRNL